MDTSDTPRGEERYPGAGRQVGSRRDRRGPVAALRYRERQIPHRELWDASGGQQRQIRRVESGFWQALDHRDGGRDSAFLANYILCLAGQVQVIRMRQAV